MSAGFISLGSLCKRRTPAPRCIRWLALCSHDSESGHAHPSPVTSPIRDRREERFSLRVGGWGSTLTPLRKKQSLSIHGTLHTFFVTTVLTWGLRICLARRIMYFSYLSLHPRQLVLWGQAGRPLKERIWIWPTVRCPMQKLLLALRKQAKGLGEKH